MVPKNVYIFKVCSTYVQMLSATCEDRLKKNQYLKKNAYNQRINFKPIDYIDPSIFKFLLTKSESATLCLYLKHHHIRSNC
jgi:competence transcription factor ComK